MVVNGLPEVEQMLQQMRALVRIAENNENAKAVSEMPISEGFAEALQRSLKRVSATQNSAAAQVKAFELGAPNIELNDVMINIQKANISFHVLVQIRNKLLAAYKEVAAMTI